MKQRPFSAMMAFALALGLLSFGGAVSAAPRNPSIRLFVAAPSTTVVRYGNQRWVTLDVGAWVASTGGAFQLNISRPDYATAPTITQVDATTGQVLRTLPSSLFTDWGGFANFFRVKVWDHTGHLVNSETTSFCPDTFDPERLNDTGPGNSPYPSECGYNPFAFSAVWGIADGWATPVLSDQGGYYGPYGAGSVIFGGRDGHYEVKVSIMRPYRNLLGVRAVDARTSVRVHLTTRSGCCAGAGTRAGPQHRSAPAPVPTVTTPDPSTLPDLRVLPAWGIFVHANRHGKGAELSFGATVWNRGPQVLDVEGFRQPGANLMDAFQYFFDSNGDTVGRAPVGQLQFDSDPSHYHWHFAQFATYSLLDASQTEVLRSTKVGFCIAPTDPLDLTAPGAVWNPGVVGLETACGSINSVWTREALPAGWGDTYTQYLAGQAFNVKNLPSGIYYIQVTANPLGALFETDTTNDTSLREVILSGEPGGTRTVTVPPYQGIDA